MEPQFLSVGYITRDTVGGREQAGGSALYGAMAAQGLGMSSAIFSSIAQDFPPKDFLGAVSLVRSPSPTTTRFCHFYDSQSGRRCHRLDVLASTIEEEHVPNAYRRSSMVLLCPNYHEVGPQALMWFETDWLALSPQGWFRHREETGHVRFGRAKWSSLPRRVKLCVVSEDDLAGDPQAWHWLQSCSDVAVKTLGARGHIVAVGGKETERRPPYLAKEVDPTGAGDVFAAAMLIALKEGQRPLEAAQFASAAASVVVEVQGMTCLPTREKIQRRLVHP